MPFDGVAIIYFIPTKKSQSNLCDTALKKCKIKAENFYKICFPIFSQNGVIFPKKAKNLEVCKCHICHKILLKKVIIYFIYNIQSFLVNMKIKILWEKIGKIFIKFIDKALVSRYNIFVQ